MPLKNGRTSADLQTTVVGTVIPAGTVAPFGGTTVPAGWLLCDGSTVSRSLYPNLFSAVGTAHGQGDGSTTFHLPDYRGRFLRGADNMGTGAAGRDPAASSRTAANTGGNTGNAIGSVQDSDNKLHGHPYYTASGYGNWGASAGGFTRYSGYSSVPAYTGTPSTDINQQIGGSGTGESRPQNAACSYIIKV